jgi:hypothetical protein
VYRELYRERQEDEKEMKENEQGMHQYWKTQALDCHKELLKQIAALARERGDGSNCIS